MRRSVPKSSRFWWVWKGRVGQGMWPITAMPPRNAHGPFRTRKEVAMGMSTRNNPSSKCVVCHGDLAAMGQLGNLKWFRCRACGMEQSRKVKAWPPKRKIKQPWQKNPFSASGSMVKGQIDASGWHGSRRSAQKHAAAMRSQGYKAGVATLKNPTYQYPIRLLQNRKGKRNPIEPVGGGHMITGKAVQLYRLLALKHAIKLELTTGMKMSRGISPFAIVKQELGFKGNKQKIYDQLVKYIEQVGPGLAQNPAREFDGVKYWRILRWNDMFGRMDFIAKVRATYREIRKHFPGARVSRLDMLVGEVVVTKKSQVRVPAKVRK